MPRSAAVAPSNAMPAADRERLNPFVGRWNIAGVQRDGRVGPAAEISGSESYEWLEGGHFLIHRFDATVGVGTASCIEIIGSDPGSETYAAHTYYSNGQRAEWRLVEASGVWTISGEWPMLEGPAKVRCRMEFSDAGNRRTAVWESCGDEGHWEVFWEVRATRG